MDTPEVAAQFVAEGAAPHSRCLGLVSLQATEIARGAARKYGDLTGRQPPEEIFVLAQQYSEARALAAAAGVPGTIISDAAALTNPAVCTSNGRFEFEKHAPTACVIRLTTGGWNNPLLDTILRHEVYHCYQLALLYPDFYDGSSDWVLEGSATYAAMLTARFRTQANAYSRATWIDYLSEPGEARDSLTARDYDGMGFFSHLHRHLRNRSADNRRIFEVMDDIILRSRHRDLGSANAFSVATQAADETFLTSWAAGVGRLFGTPGTLWNTIGLGIPPNSEASTIPHLPIVGGGGFRKGLTRGRQYLGLLTFRPPSGASGKVLELSVRDAHTAYQFLSNNRPIGNPVQKANALTEKWCTRSAGCCPRGRRSALIELPEDQMIFAVGTGFSTPRGEFSLQYRDIESGDCVQIPEQSTGKPDREAPPSGPRVSDEGRPPSSLGPDAIDAGGCYWWQYLAWTWWCLIPTPNTSPLQMERPCTFTDFTTLRTLEFPYPLAPPKVSTAKRPTHRSYRTGFQMETPSCRSFHRDRFDASWRRCSGSLGVWMTLRAELNTPRVPGSVSENIAMITRGSNPAARRVLQAPLADRANVASVSGWSLSGGWLETLRLGRNQTRARSSR